MSPAELRMQTCDVEMAGQVELQAMGRGSGIELSLSNLLESLPQKL